MGSYFSMGWDGGAWIYSSEAGQIDSSSVDTTFPAKTGWSTAVVSYDDNFWVAASEFVEITDAMWAAQYGVNGYQNLWVRMVGPIVYEWFQYSVSKVFTIAEIKKMLKYCGTGASGSFSAGFSNGFG
jgi:hypothetical protein